MRAPDADPGVLNRNIQVTRIRHPSIFLRTRVRSCHRLLGGSSDEEQTLGHPSHGRTEQEPEAVREQPSQTTLWRWPTADIAFCFASLLWFRNNGHPRRPHRRRAQPRASGRAAAGFGTPQGAGLLSIRSLDCRSDRAGWAGGRAWG